MNSSDRLEQIAESPKELAHFLLQHKKNDVSETAQFLLQALDQLPGMDKISADLINDPKTEGCEHAEEDDQTQIQMLPSPIDDSDTAEITVSATTPRTKLNLSMLQNKIVLTSPKDEKIVLRSDDVEHVVFFPKREDCLKKPKRTKDGQHIIIPGSQVLLTIKSENVKFRKKQLSLICLQLPQHFSERIELPDEPRPTEEELINVCIDNFEEKLVSMLTSSLSLEKDRVCRVYNPKFHHLLDLPSYSFQSDDGGANKSIMQGQMPYLKCYNGVNDGVIYPMEEGLLFFKPPLFIHRSKLHSIAVGRGGGSRYIDLHATLDDSEGEKTEIEFTNIDREEMTVLNSYIHNTLVKAMAKDAKEGDNEKDGDENDKANSTDDDDENDADDDDYDYKMGIPESDDDEDDSEGNVKEEGSLSETSQPSRKRSRRQAATDSRKATKYDLNTSNNPTDENSDSDDDDDDDDYKMVEKKDEDSSEDEGDTDDNASASDGTVSEDNEEE